MPLLLPVTSLSREQLHLALIIHLGRCRTSQCQEITGQADRQANILLPFLYNWSSLESEFIANFSRIQRNPLQQSLAVAHEGVVGVGEEDRAASTRALLPAAATQLYAIEETSESKGETKRWLKPQTEWQLWESVAGTWYSWCAVDRRVRSLELWVTGD